MLISKKSPRESSLFKSRFRTGEGGDFDLRQYHRCREEIFSSFVHLGLLFAFMILLLLFGRAIWHLFAHHGVGLNPLYRAGVMGLLGAMVASVLRRFWRKYQAIRLVRAEMKFFRTELRRDHGEFETGNGDD